MSILVVGSVALDYIETPSDKLEQALGGSASFIAVTASYFSKDVRMVAIVGGDFPDRHIAYFTSRGIHLNGLVRVPEGKTFSWGGRYHADMNHRDTLYTELGVFEHFDPAIPNEWRESEYVMLGNIHPSLQLRVLDQIAKPKLVVCDTMNLWIDISLAELTATIARVDALILNDQEAKMLTKLDNIFSAGRQLLAMGPSIVVVKKGEHGAVLMTRDHVFSVPAFPLERIVDPTGAGDTFAGGFIGWLAKTGDTDISNLKRAVVYGTAMASYAVERFSIEGIRELSAEQIIGRYQSLHDMTSFQP